MVAWKIIESAIKVVGIAALASTAKALLERDTRIAELEQENRFLREQLEEQRTENELHMGGLPQAPDEL